MEKNLGGEQTIAENKDVVKEKLLKERAVVEENNDEAKLGNTKESEEDDESFAWCDDQLSENDEKMMEKNLGGEQTIADNKDQFSLFTQKV